jgi:hypothetical protein
MADLASRADTTELLRRIADIESSIEDESVMSVDPLTVLAAARLLISLYRELRRRAR